MIKKEFLRESAPSGTDAKNYHTRITVVNNTFHPADTFDTALWGRIQSFAFDPPDAKLTFAVRLARETGWTSAFADQAIREYRRFLYLAVRAGHPVTPSQEVDEVWHLHLMYTRHYWGVLCKDVLEHDLHHGPSLGGASEHARYHDLYDRTLDSYARIFGNEPPDGFWPSADQRFRPKPRAAAVDPTTHWIIPKPTWRKPTWLRRPMSNLQRGFALVCFALLTLGAPPVAFSWAAGSGSKSNDHGLAILLSMLGAVGLFKVVRLFAETPAQRSARKQREAERRQNSSNGGSMSSGGCGSDGSSGCGSGCGGGCS
jgi:hypothetical protein